MPELNSSCRNIRQLPTQLANQIAAGEVVERPASVVKELIENCIDANASKIVIEIEAGGHKKICIRDNGDGIAKEDIGLALSQHATSKVYDLDELENISTMGFRGEALASIASVSRLTLTSKPVQQDSAWQVNTERYEKHLDIQPAAHPNGTSVEVVDLFFNTPARRRFLRAPKTEFQHIEKVVKCIALAHPAISFDLIHNGKTTLRLFKSSTYERIQKVFKQSVNRNLLPFDYASPNLKLNGWISEVGFGADTNENQFLFINHRVMKDKLLIHAIRQAYEGMIPSAKYPCFAVFLTMEPSQFDVNVHPAKHEVRFHEARNVHDAVYRAVDNTLLNSIKNESSAELNANRESLEVAESAKNLSKTLGNHYESTHSYIIKPEAITRPAKVDPPRDDLHVLNASSNNAAGISVNRVPPYQNKIQNNATTQNHARSQSAKSIHQTLSNMHELSSSTITEIPVVCIGNHTIFKIEEVVYKQANDQLAYSFLCESNSDSERELITQPLLMPVTVKSESINSQFTTIMNQSGFDVQYRSGKLVLLQVPANLKHLPWTGIFAKITQQNGISSPENAYKAIAAAWCVQITVSENIVKYWLSRFDKGKSHWLEGASVITEDSLQGLC